MHAVPPPLPGSATRRYSSQDRLIGTHFEGRFHIQRRLGRGGMATVYEAMQTRLGRRVAIKVMRPDCRVRGGGRERFLREARIMAGLRHPNIVSIVDFGTTREGLDFLVMELVDGEPLSALIKREGPLAPERVRRIAAQILAALAEAHAAGIVHRDLKPDNLLITCTSAGDDHVTLVDFGIAKSSSRGTSPAIGDENVSLTRTGCFVGSPRYVAPEQARGEPIDGRTDLYTFGAVVHEMLSGRHLFGDLAAIEYVLAHMDLPAPTPTVDGAPIPDAALVSLVVQCLAKSPSARPPSARAALAFLRSTARTEPELAAAPEPPAREAKTVMLPAATDPAPADSQPLPIEDIDQTDVEAIPSFMRRPTCTLVQRSRPRWDVSARLPAMAAGLLTTLGAGALLATLVLW